MGRILIAMVLLTLTVAKASESSRVDASEKYTFIMYTDPGYLNHTCTTLVSLMSKVKRPIEVMIAIDGGPCITDNEKELRNKLSRYLDGSGTQLMITQLGSPMMSEEEWRKEYRKCVTKIQNVLRKTGLEHYARITTVDVTHLISTMQTSVLRFSLARMGEWEMKGRAFIFKTNLLLSNNHEMWGNLKDFVWLDSDMLITEDLTELYEACKRENPILAAVDLWQVTGKDRKRRKPSELIAQELEVVEPYKPLTDDAPSGMYERTSGGMVYCNLRYNNLIEQNGLSLLINDSRDGAPTHRNPVVEDDEQAYDWWCYNLARVIRTKRDGILSIPEAQRNRDGTKWLGSYYDTIARAALKRIKLSPRYNLPPKKYTNMIQEDTPKREELKQKVAVWHWDTDVKPWVAEDGGERMVGLRRREMNEIDRRWRAIEKRVQAIMDEQPKQRQMMRRSRSEDLNHHGTGSRAIE